MLLGEMNELWRAAGATFFTRTYRVYPTAARTGYIEALANAVPVLAAGEATSSVTS